MQPILKTACVVLLVTTAGCDSPSKSNERAKLAFKQVDCAEVTGIQTPFSLSIVKKDGKTKEIFVPGNGVSEAQAAKANACMESQ